MQQSLPQHVDTEHPHAQHSLAEHIGTNNGRAEVTLRLSAACAYLMCRLRLQQCTAKHHIAKYCGTHGTGYIAADPTTNGIANDAFYSSPKC